MTFPVSGRQDACTLARFSDLSPAMQHRWIFPHCCDRFNAVFAKSLILLK
jgi:hypothetical protein